MYPYIRFFGLEIPTYFLSMVSGIVFATLLIFYLNKKHKEYHLPKNDLLYVVVFIGMGGILGSRVLYIITQIPYLIDGSQNILTVMSGGAVFYGGIIGGFLFGWYYIRQYGLNPGKYLNLVIIGIPLGHAFGRLGCFLAGCCYGAETDSIFGVVFPEGPLHTGAGHPVHPTQLYEIVFNLFLLSILLILFFKKKNHQPFFFLKLYLIGYGSFRFVNEFFRGDDIRGVFILSTSQWISVAIVLLGILLFVIDISQFEFFKQKPPKNKNYREILKQKDNKDMN